MKLISNALSYWILQHGNYQDCFFFRIIDNQGPKTAGRIMLGDLVDKGRLIPLLPLDKLTAMVEVCFRLDISFEEVKRSGNGFTRNKRVRKNIYDQIHGMTLDAIREKVLGDFRLTKWPGDEAIAEEMLARYRGRHRMEFTPFSRARFLPEWEMVWFNGYSCTKCFEGLHFPIALSGVL